MILKKNSFKDPLDKKYVHVKESRVEFAGQGLYARKYIPANIHFSSHGGYLYDKEQYALWLQVLEEEKTENGWKFDEPLWHLHFQYQFNLHADTKDPALRK